ncbi:DMT family transporter [Necropsobacter massiliensis]|uniref:DMT family transporter n=1 Tax=Necropsobacter massiliensis TaxID=1400001 RepID=UPI000595BE6B|nr:SMR family transporter [Necropsobacter massiliensis]
MNHWILLSGAIGLEIIATSLLKASDGFTKTAPTVGALLLYGLSFYLLAIVLRTLPVGIAYAVWSGVGIILTAIVAYFVFGQKIDLAGGIGIGLIIAGVLVINLFSANSH